MPGLWSEGRPQNIAWSALKCGFRFCAAIPLCVNLMVYKHVSVLASGAHTSHRYEEGDKTGAGVVIIESANVSLDSRATHSRK